MVSGIVIGHSLGSAANTIAWSFPMTRLKIEPGGFCAKEIQVLCQCREHVDVSVLGAGGVSQVMYKLHLLVEIFTAPGDKFLQELKHCRSSVTPFIGYQYALLVQHSLQRVFVCPTSLTYRNLVRTCEKKLKLHLMPGVSRSNFRWRMWRLSCRLYFWYFSLPMVIVSLFPGMYAALSGRFRKRSTSSSFDRQSARRS